jgi:glycine/D-amino acid oxidase-like deaminating enzyme
MERRQPVSGLSRRGFLSAALVGLVPKAGRRLEGGLVHESATVGHRLRDGLRLDAPRETRHAAVVIVGGGIAGLSAAWRLQKRGVTDLAVLELEAVPGGNARWGENEIAAFPWGAHYVPVPGRAGGLVRELFTDLGVYDGTRWDERHLVHAPAERLFLHGRWQEGLEPQVGPAQRDRDQFARFEARVAALAATGRFTIPSAAGLGDGPAPAEDRLSMAAWLDREGLDSPWLRWVVDYACRDDYGGLAGDVSAWAGLLYFAGREGDAEGPLTWPEGNGWIVRRLLERLGPVVQTGRVAHRVARQGGRWQVLTPGVAWTADVVIVATPMLVASRLVEGLGPAGVTYSPWITANLVLDRWPRERGLPPAWDNVIFDSRSLGYVVATHQQLRRFVPRTVWTHYWALAHHPAADARRWLLAQDWGALSTLVLDDLQRAHPDIRDCVSRIDVLRLGHAMVRPGPGFLSQPARRALQGDRGDGLYFAHSDLSGLPLFEEAQYRGVVAADRALARLGGRP